MKKLLLLLSTVSAISAADVDGLTTGMEDLAIGYSSDVEYDKHQKVHERFFRRTTKNTAARTAIDKFAAEFSADPSKLSRISLDGLSSRTRIIMMRELIIAANGAKLSIPLSFHGTEFNLNLTPTPDQPGSGILTCIGSYKDDVFPVLTSYKEAYQAKYAKKLAKARKVSDGHGVGGLDYHPAIVTPELTEDGKRVDLEMLNLLLDFEVTRRLIGSSNEYAKRFDSVPVGSAIVGLLQLPQKDKTDPTFVPLETFFDGKDETIASKIFRNGEFNAFEGSAGNPSYSNNPAHRELATKKIIRKHRGGSKAKLSTKETIHQEYLTYYGGASESDGSDYDSK